MLLHIIFVLSGLIRKQKRIQNSIESGFRKFGKEKEKDFSTLSGFWPVGPAAWLHSPVGPLPPPFLLAHSALPTCHSLKQVAQFAGLLPLLA
jgi:hypothetical protein